MISRIYLGYSITTGSTANAMVCVSKSTKNMNRALLFFEDFNSKAVVSPALGFSVDTEPIKTEIAACQNVYAEIGNGLGTGMLEPEEYGPKFLAKLKAAGSDKIVAEVQRQLDE